MAATSFRTRQALPIITESGPPPGVPSLTPAPANDATFPRRSQAITDYLDAAFVSGDDATVYWWRHPGIDTAAISRAFAERHGLRLVEREHTTAPGGRCIDVQRVNAHGEGITVAHFTLPALTGEVA